MIDPATQRFVDPQAEALLARVGAPRRALFLDRDGVINVDHGYVHRAQDVRWIPGIFDLVRAAGEAGFLPIVVTNQAGIARGYYNEATFLAFTAWMHAEFARHGAPLLATYFCPHHPEAGLGRYKVACPCRKPAPGMLLAAIDAFAIDPAASVLVGDKPGDIEAAQAAGVGQAVQIHADPDAAPGLATPLAAAWAMIGGATPAP